MVYENATESDTIKDLKEIEQQKVGSKDASSQLSDKTGKKNKKTMLVIQEMRRHLTIEKRKVMILEIYRLKKKWNGLTLIQNLGQQKKISNASVKKKQTELQKFTERNTDLY